MLKNFKKILTTILMAVMLLSLTKPIFAFSSSGSDKWVAGQYNSGIKTTDSNGIIIRRLTNYTTNEKITVFCTEFGVESSTGKIENAEHIVPTDPLMKTACKIAYFGWYSRYGEYAVDGGILTEGFKQVKIDYVFTQQMIWEVLDQSNATFIDSNIQNQYILFKEEINSKIKNMQLKPSFCNTVLTIDIGQTITLTDENAVLADYLSVDKTIQGIQIKHNKGENIMTITAKDECTIENYTITEDMMKSWGVIKENSKDNNTTIFFSFKDGVQDQLYSMHYNEPVAMSINLQVNQFGNIELSKLDEKGKLIDGAVFQITGPDNFSKEVTVTNGKVKIEKLKKGTYTIKEKAPPKGYILNTEVYTVNVSPNQTSTQTIINEKPTGTLIIKKNVETRENVDTSLIDVSDLSDIQFKLIAKEDIIDYSNGNIIYKKGSIINTYNLDKYGNLKIEQLPLGVYEIQECHTLDGLVLNTEKHEVKFVQKDEITKIYIQSKQITNNTTLIEISKTDITGEKELVGAKLNIIDESGKMIDTWISTEETHKIEGLAVGKNYTLREEFAPDGYVKAAEVKFKVENTSQIQTVKIKDKTVVVSKIDSETGEELPGAELIVKDKEGNVIDKWISSSDKHRVIGLEEGQEYILTEVKSPYGYEIAEPVIFKVTLDKQTQNVEMKDMKIYKTIKMIKVDSESKNIIKSNFKFGIYENPECSKLVKEVNADKENGTVIFEKLRYGTYYIKEIEAPSGYLLSDKIIKIEINDKGNFADGQILSEEDNSISTITYYNKQIPKIQTGNETNYALLIGSIMVSILSIFIIFQKFKNK